MLATSSNNKIIHLFIKLQAWYRCSCLLYCVNNALAFLCAHAMVCIMLVKIFSYLQVINEHIIKKFPAFTTSFCVKYTFNKSEWQRVLGFSISFVTRQLTLETWLSLRMDNELAVTIPFFLIVMAVNKV